MNVHHGVCLRRNIMRLINFKRLRRVGIDSENVKGNKDILNNATMKLTLISLFLGLFILSCDSVTNSEIQPPESFSVIFEKNDDNAVGSMNDQILLINSENSLIPCSFVKNNWKFDGWATSPEGEVEYADEAKILIEDSDITLYAKWKTNCITYNKNDSKAGGSIEDQNVLPGETAVLTENRFTKEGWTFDGWATSSAGEVEYDNNDDITMELSDSCITLFAKWTAINYTITYNENNPQASGVITNQVIPCDSTENLNENNFSILGFSFIGWSTTSDGISLYEDKESYTMGSSDITLYAVWSEMIFPYTEGELTYIRRGDNLTLISCTDEAPGDIIIPGEINGLVITEIESRVFELSGKITNVTIPGSVTKIGVSAFRGTSITEITIPAGVTDFPYGIFRDCRELERINMYPLTAPTVNANSFTNTHFVTLHIQSSGTSGYDVTPWTNTILFSSIVADL